MDPRLLDYYNRELRHLREMAAEFAAEFPKIAGRLGLDGVECEDPYVERLLEGFAFLAARVQLKLDAEFPRFTQHMLELLYPNYLAPTPSMAVVRLAPDRTEGTLNEGFVVPRDTALRSVLGAGEQTSCEYRTAHDVTLWPIELIDVDYFTYSGDMVLDASGLERARSGLRFRLRALSGWTFDKLRIDRLPVYLRGTDEIPMRVYERLLAGAVALAVRPADRSDDWHEVLDASYVRAFGFEDDHALLPYGTRSFQGYRLLHEYFSFPERFMFVELAGLGHAVRRCTGDEIDLMVLLDRSDSSLENAVDASQFALFCTPAVNLFPKRADRIHLDAREHEYHVVPDRTRPLDYEVYDVLRVVGHGTGSENTVDFLPYYSSDDVTAQQRREAYFTVRRAPKVLSSTQQRRGQRSSHVGSEVYVALVDGDEAPYRSDLRQLAVEVRCTNRDLPLFMSVGGGPTDFTLETGAPVEAVKVLAGPTRPKPSWPEGETSWRLISHLSLNYLSLLDGESERNAAALRQMLALYADLGRANLRKQIDGVRGLTSSPVVRRLPTHGPIAFGRGLAITVTCEESAFEGSGVFLLGAVLERFFAKYVSINSFTETTLSTVERGEVMRWGLRAGTRLTL